ARKPVVPIGNLSTDVGEELLLDALGDRPAFAVADRHAIDAPNRSDLGGSAAEEDFVRDVEHLARNESFDDFVSEFARHLDDARARDAGENRRAERRREDASVADEEHVLPRTLADVTIDVEGDPFGISIDRRFLADQNGV